MKFSVLASFALASLASSSLTIAAANDAHLFPDYHAPVSANVTAQPSKAAGSTSTVGTPMANAYRDYPPSCSAYPLPDKASGPSQTSAVTAFAYTSTGAASSENINVTVWRLPCSSSGASTPYNATGGKNAMTLVRIDRNDDTVTSIVPLRPRLFITQGATNYGLVRVAAEPNTVVSEAAFGVAMQNSGTYVLENYSGSTARLDFLGAFKLTVAGGLATVDISVPAYAPTQDTYPDAFNPIALDGYAAAQYYNPERNEGLIVQVAEGYDGANPKRRQLGFDLLTKDAANKPFWIVGAAAFDPVAGGVRGLDIPVSYLVDNNATQAWGKVHVAMTSCSQMSVTFTPAAGLPTGVPSITGTIAYARLLSANGMSCE